MAKKDKNQAIEPVVEKQAKVQKPAPVPTLLSSGAWTTSPTAEIACSECGKTRIITIQDLFQVTRCVECQKKHTNKVRNQKKVAANRAARDKVKLEEAYRLVAEAESKSQAGQE